MRIMARSSSNRNSASARASSVLPTPVGPRKMKVPMGRLGSFKPDARAHHRFGHGVHGFVLADDALVQLLFEVQQLLHLAFEQLRDRNAGPAADDLRRCLPRRLPP